MTSYVVWEWVNDNNISLPYSSEVSDELEKALVNNTKEVSMTFMSVVLTVYYLLFIIYYLLFIIYYLLFIIYYLLFIIYYLLFIIYYLLFIIYYLLFIIYYLLFIIYYLLFIIYYYYLLFIIYQNKGACPYMDIRILPMSHNSVIFGPIPNFFNIIFEPKQNEFVCIVGAWK